MISIVALLVALTLPSLGRAREQGRIITCASQQKQVALAMLTYANDNKQWLIGTSYTQPQVFRDPFIQYLGYNSDAPRAPILACPSTRNARSGGATNSHTPGRQTGIDKFTASYWFPGAWGSYPVGLSNAFFGWQSGWVGGSATRTGSNASPCPNVEFAGSARRSVYTGSDEDSYGTVGMTLWINQPSEQPIIVDAYAPPGSIWSNATTGDWFSNHVDGVNVMHLDGHGTYKTEGYIIRRHRQIWW